MSTGSASADEIKLSKEFEMIIKTYTLQETTDVSVLMNDFGLSLDSVDPSGEADRLAIYGKDEDGEYPCWDGTVQFMEDGGIVCKGADGPSGGSHEVEIVLVIPFAKIGKVTMEKGWWS